MKTISDRRGAVLVRIKKQVQELIRMRAEDLITDQEFLEQKAALIERRSSIETSSVETVISGEQIRREINEVTVPLTQLRNTWHALELPFRRRFERLVLPVGFVNGKSRTAELGLCFQVLRALSANESNEVPLMGNSSNLILQEIREFRSLFREAWGNSMPSEKAVRRNATE